MNARKTAPPIGKTAARFRFFFATPWWRLPCWLAAIVWAIGLNIAYIAGGGANEWLGFASVVPVYALVLDLLLRDRRRHRPSR